MQKLHFLTLMLLTALLVAPESLAAPASTLDANDPYEPLYSGPAALAVETLNTRVQNNGTAQDRFALGVAQTLTAFEHLTQSLNRYGLKTEATDGLMMLGLPGVAIDNPAEDSIDAAKFRSVIDRFYTDLSQAQQTLETVEPGDDLKLVLDIARVRLDYDGDGQAGEDEQLARLMQRLEQQLGGGFDDADDQPADARQEASFPIALDGGDVYWLRGYCHLLMGFADFALAHDTDDLFNHTAQLFFARVDTPFPYLVEKDNANGFDMAQISDFIAFIHLIRLDVKDPARMKAALGHFREVSAMSRKSWQAILAETDNDREWIPSPQQESVLGDLLEVDQTQVDAWTGFLDEYDAIFAGKKLVPFWRGGSNEKRGVNLAKAFEKPTTFDLVLWVQGSAAKPYLEEGPVTSSEFWSELWRAFGGNFLGFAAIVN